MNVEEAIEAVSQFVEQLKTLALQARFRSRREASFAAKLLAALRREFGGHGVEEAVSG